jgi:hypothetical protein
MTKWITILTLFFVVDLQAQTKKLYFKIDTLKYADYIETILNFRPYIHNQSFLFSDDDYATSRILTFKKFPNYSVAIKLESDSSTIEIPIDFSGSSIILKNVYDLNSDTLTIDLWKIYASRPIDTTYTIIEYYKKINGQLDEKPYKQKRKVKVNKAKNPPLTITLTINGKLYNVNLTLKKEPDTILHGHGYKPRKHLDKNGDFKKRLTYFYVNSLSKKYIWKGEQDLTGAK